MAAYTVIINPRTNKTKHLLALIREMAKGEKYITIEPENEPENEPNEETLKAMQEAEKGGLKKHRSVSALLKELDS